MIKNFRIREVKFDNGLSEFYTEMYIYRWCSLPEYKEPFDNFNDAKNTIIKYKEIKQQVNIIEEKIYYI